MLPKTSAEHQQVRCEELRIESLRLLAQYRKQRLDSASIMMEMQVRTAQLRFSRSENRRLKLLGTLES